MSVHYIYAIAGTSGTTGFAVCQPEPEPDFAQGLAMLACRPLDTFLHRHMLKMLLAEKPATWQALATKCLAGSQKSTASLLVEATILNPYAKTHLAEYLPSLRALATPWHEVTPLTLLAAQFAHHNSSGDSYYRSIHQHEQLTPSHVSAEAQALAAEMANARGMLKKLHANFRPQQHCENIPDPVEVHARACACLDATGIADGQEMRHEATLSPIALLRSWRLSASVEQGRNTHTLGGTATAYGRGLKLSQARAACNMEIIERACAHAKVENGGNHGKIGQHELLYASFAELVAAGAYALSPLALLHASSPPPFFAELEHLPLHWLPGCTATGKKILVPAQAVYLFSNLDEICIFDAIGSTGLAAGSSMSMARLAALSEILERDAHATTPFDAKACFELQSRDAAIQSLLDDYRWRGIHVQFQDISNEFGFPAFRAFVKSRDNRIIQATGAGLSGPHAALAAFTEIPWPYSWAQTAQAVPSGPGLPGLPRRVLEDLPDYSLSAIQDSLALLEKALATCGHDPIYIDISRPELAFPVCRAFIPGLATDPELEYGPSLRLLARQALYAMRIQ